MIFLNLTTSTIQLYTATVLNTSDFDDLQTVKIKGMSISHTQGHLKTCSWNGLLRLREVIVSLR